jgi:hypothetical protein
MFKAVVKRALAAAGYTLFRTRNRYSQDGLLTLHGDSFRRTSEFRQAYQRGLKASGGVDSAFEWRVHIALWAARTSLAAGGDFVECGVNAGFMSSAIMHHLRWNTLDRRFYLIDTFSGPVLDQFSPQEKAKGRRDLAERTLAAGGYVTDLERTRANYAEWPRAVVVQGAVPQVLLSLNIDKVAFLHIDMNCAYPEQAALEYFWSKLTRGAIVLLDDYAYFGHEEQREAIDASATKLGVDVLSLPTGQGMIVKP